MKINLDELAELAKNAEPTPWHWEKPENKRESDVLCAEYIDDDENNISTLIHRDSGVYGPSVETCEYIIAANPQNVLALIEVVKASQKYLNVRKIENDDELDWELFEAWEKALEPFE